MVAEKPRQLELRVTSNLDIYSQRLRFSHSGDQMSRPKGSILITGANGGLGCAFVAHLLKSVYAHEYQGLYAVCNPSTAHNLQTVLECAPAEHKSEILLLDLSRLESVRGFAEDINTRVSNGTLVPIRALILNAAWQEANSGTLKPKTFTDDGYEAHFAINYLANFLLVLMLLQSMDRERGRIIFVCSWIHDTGDSRNNTTGQFAGDEYKILFRDVEALSKGVEY